MNILDKMIEKLCPDGLVYKKLTDLCTVLKKGTLKTSELMNTGTYPVVNSGREFYGFYDKYNNEGNAITFAARGEYAGFVTYLSTEFWAGGLCYPYRSKDEKIIKTKFIYYYLKSIENTIMSFLVSRGSIPAINKKEVDNILLPVPPLEIQCKIVYTLENFTDVSSELLEKLSLELKARRKQFEYYKNKLYSFDNETIKYEKLGMIAQIYRGGNFQKKDFVEKGKPCIHYGQIHTKYRTITEKTITFLNEDTFNKSKKAQKDDIIMAVTSENIEDVCKCVIWHGEEEIAVSGHTAIIRHNINTKYLGYYFSTIHFFKQKEKLAHGTKVIEVTPSSLNDILIPIPSLEIQEKIANILEKFDKLCDDISEGLTVGIKAREKQYEYYRDKLLTFNRKNKALSKIE